MLDGFPLNVAEHSYQHGNAEGKHEEGEREGIACLLYTSDAADE